MKGRVAIVTGAARGIGRDICLKLAGKGADIVAADLLEDDLKETVKLVSALGVKAVAKTVNVTDTAAIDEVLQKTERFKGDICGYHAISAKEGTVYRRHC